MTDLLEIAKGHTEIWKAGYREGFRHAIEEAARICDKDSTGKVCQDIACQQIADRIWEETEK